MLITRGALDRLDVSATGCILLDRLGLVAHMNKAAEALLGAVLQVRQGLISLPTVELTSRLHAEIRRALATRPPKSAEPPRSLVWRDLQGVIVFEALRLPDADIHAFRRCRCMLLIHRTGISNLFSVETFRATFGLSRQEAVLTDALSRSKNLVKAAKGLGISHETARSQLKAVFNKTGTQSQAELLVMIGELKLLGR